MDRSWKKTKSSRLATYGLAALLILGLLCPAAVFAGSLNAPQGPGSQSVSRYTLKNILDRLYDGTTGTPLPASPFAEPPTGAISPTIKSTDYPLITTTDYPLNDIMGLLPAVDMAASPNGGALDTEVCASKTFWGLRSGTGWGLKTGTRPCNRRPKAVDDRVGLTTNEDTTLSPISVLSNDTDDDSDPLTVSTFDTTSANGGTVARVGVTQTLSYTPPLNFSGKDSFQYTISDGSLTDTGTVTVTVTAVNDAPTSSADSFTVAENGILYGNLTGSDTEGSPLTYSIVSNGTHGTASIIPNTNAFKYDASSYEPPTQSDVSDSFTFRVYDGVAYSSNATISITITAVNDAPVLATNAGLSVTRSTCSFIRNTVLQVTDVDNTTANISFTRTVAPTKGALQIRSASTCSNLCSDTPGGWASTTTFTQADIDSCRIRYNETSGTAGSDSFTFTVSDGSGGSIGSTTFNITVN